MNAERMPTAYNALLSIKANITGQGGRAPPCVNVFLATKIRHAIAPDTWAKKIRQPSGREIYKGQRTGTDYICSHREKKICGDPRFHRMEDICAWMCIPDVRDSDGTDRLGRGGEVRHVESGGQRYEVSQTSYRYKKLLERAEEQQ